MDITVVIMDYFTITSAALGIDDQKNGYLISRLQIPKRNQKKVLKI